ncbi:MAG: ATP-binding protein [Alphaproteobacteria bacterium]|nr:ATP-binding protein [Alphaproteobacteria bacterium]
MSPGSSSSRSAATIDDVAQTIVRRVALALNAHAAVLMPRHDNLAVVASIPAELTLDTASSAAMDWVFRHRKPAGFRSDTLPAAPFFGLPLQTGTNVLGVLAVQAKDGSALTPTQNNFLVGLTYQAAAAVERAKLTTDVEQARLQTEMERLRTSLLSSVSRDMREPLDTIIMTSRNLNNRWNDIPVDERHAFVSDIEQESDRLDRFIENFLDMTELVTGNMRLRRTETNVGDVISLAMARLHRYLKERKVVFECPPDLPAINADATALRRVFVNIIENSCSYSLPDQPIKISVARESDSIRIVVTDRGIGIPETERERVFDMFYRIRKEASETAALSRGGAGLGLSICRGLIEAHNGTIAAHAGENGVGTSVTIILPLESKPR